MGGCLRNGELKKTERRSQFWELGAPLPSSNANLKAATRNVRQH